MNERVPVTTAGYKAWQDRLRQLKEVERPQNVRDIELALEHGDLSENAEYHAAKEKQGMIAAYMRDIEDKISRAQVIDPSTLSGDKVMFGASVTLLDLDKDEEITYQIVGEDEADLKEGKISVTSPLARAIIGKQDGDEVQFKAPGGLREYEIMSVKYG